MTAKNRGFLSSSHFSCNSTRLFLLEGNEDKSVQPGRRNLKRKIQYENQDLTTRHCWNADSFQEKVRFQPEGYERISSVAATHCLRFCHVGFGPDGAPEYRC